jgi:myo-inositol-1(or 4)-monophosphatase
LFAVSVGFCDEQGAAVGAIREPMRAETFTAQRGGDFTINGVVTRSSGCTRMDRAIIASSLPFRTPSALTDAEPVFCAVQRACDDHRRTGAASIDLAWVAAGRMDAYYELGIHPWDIAAGMVMVRCAGGVVTDYRGSTDGLLGQRSIVAAATPELHAALLPFVAPLIPWLDRPAFGGRGACA